MSDPQKTFRRLCEDAAGQQAMVPGLALHLSISRLPHPIDWLEQALAPLANRPGTLFRQVRQSMDGYRAATA